MLLEALLPRDLITGLHQQHAAKQLGPRSQCMGGCATCGEARAATVCCGQPRKRATIRRARP